MSLDGIALLVSTIFQNFLYSHFIHMHPGGNCYKVTYSGKSVYMLAVDHTDSGINMSFEGMNDLT